MSFFDQIINKIFPRSKEKVVLTNEVLKASKKDYEDYYDWINSEDSATTLDSIFRAYHLKKTNINQDIPIVLLQSDKANGFAITSNQVLGTSDYKMLLEHFKKQVLSIGYRQSGSNRNVSAKEDIVTTKEMYYLKPPLQVEPPINQYYGNVNLELTYYNDSPGLLRVMASVYSDRLYADPYEFDELVEILFQKNNP